jgi:lipopolysaccharide/colanic/teichoic acid biosynthesis glycosyltransferase
MLNDDIVFAQSEHVMAPESAMLGRPDLVRVEPVAAPPTADRPVSARHGYLTWKRCFDFLLALVIFLIAAPIIALCMLLVRLTSRGPSLYSQTRVGLHGRVYRIFKIRTMYHNCEKRSGPQWSQAGDPRVTPLGRFLRRTHLDELPQLWNVLRGEMSLVGPRPERPEFIPTLAQAIPFYRERLNVRPGVTGLAQVQLPPDTDLDSVRRKLACDLYYAQHVSFWLDLRLLLATAAMVFGVPFRFTRVLLRLPSGLAIENATRDRGEMTARVPELKPAWQNV